MNNFPPRNRTDTLTLCPSFEALSIPGFHLEIVLLYLRRHPHFLNRYDLLFLLGFPFLFSLLVSILP